MHDKIIKRTITVQEGLIYLDDSGNVLNETELNLSEENIWNHIIEAVNLVNKQISTLDNNFDSVKLSDICEYRYLGHYFKKDNISKSSGSMSDKIIFDWAMVIIMEKEK